MNAVSMSENMTFPELCIVYIDAMKRVCDIYRLIKIELSGGDGR